MNPQEIALRTYAQPQETKKKGEGPARSWREYPRDYVLVIDTETTTDATQALLFGCYRLLDISGRKLPVGACIEEGLFHADDLADRDPVGLALLQEYAREQDAGLFLPRRRKELKWYSRREFLDRVFYRLAYKARAWVVGFNLPFDLSRLACDVKSARRAYEGGFSFVFWDYEDESGAWLEDPNRPRVLVKSLNSKQSLMCFSGRRRGDEEDFDPPVEAGGKAKWFRGHFLDLRTLAFALTDKGHSLESACRAFGVEHGKAKAEEHGVITPAYIDYNRRDVEATGELLAKLLEEYDRHPIDLQPTKAYSPASLAKANLRAMGIRPVLERQPDFPERILGHAMHAYYGGRAEARIRRQAVPVVYTDFLSMYPTVNALMGNWELLTAERIDVVDATADVRRFLQDVTLADLFRQETWLELASLVLVKPADEIFPVRARYDERSQNWQIGSNRLRSDEPLPFALPDVVAAKLLSGRVPEIVQAWRLVPVGKQPGLRALKLRGTVPVDPLGDDLFRKVIEERQRVKRRTDLEPEEQSRLDKALKCIANAGSYGIFAEQNRKEKTARVSAWNIQGERFQTKVGAPETPGEYCFPPLAAFITSGARLMLALLECQVRDRGGSYCFCDTDSMAIVARGVAGPVACPGGSSRTADGDEAIQALSWQEVGEIVGAFTALNPYDPAAVPGSILKIEADNFDGDSQRELLCYAVSAKRYVLYTHEADGRPRIVKASQHGLGHLLNPLDPDTRDRNWINKAWQHILAVDVFGETPAALSWFSRPALSRVGVSSPYLLALFDDLNHGRPYGRHVKPFNFMLSAHVDEFGCPPGADQAHFHLIAPYNPDPRQWLKMGWFDRYSGDKYRVTVAEGGASAREARIKTYGDVLLDYRFRPEHKSAAPGGGPCVRQTAGLLSRRTVVAEAVVYVGKESNRLEEVQYGLVQGEEDVLTVYSDGDGGAFMRDVVPALRSIPLAELAALARVDRRTLQRVMSGQQAPRKSTRETLCLLAETLRRPLRLPESSVEPINESAHPTPSGSVRPRCYHPFGKRDDLGRRQDDGRPHHLHGVHGSLPD